ncbi:MAG: hypothetical protein HY996_09805 [Micrococcales bacterium]|nr:hypothetical protein [Micrococcales bacterium]
MSSTPDLAALAASAAAVRLPVWGGVGDEELLRVQSAAGRLKRVADALVAEVAAEIAGRSCR